MTNQWQEIRIQFDPVKDERNYRKHHIRFSLAALVFADANRIERYDDSPENPGTEDRWQTLGKAGKVIFVVYTEREGNIIRLISARYATPTEKRSYYGHDRDNSKGWAKADQAPVGRNQ